MFRCPYNLKWLGRILDWSLLTGGRYLGLVISTSLTIRHANSEKCELNFNKYGFRPVSRQLLLLKFGFKSLFCSFNQSFLLSAKNINGIPPINAIPFNATHYFQWKDILVTKGFISSLGVVKEIIFTNKNSFLFNILHVFIRVNQTLIQ